ncbi:hypothetical protein U9475_23910, partial [Escherichia coli]
MGSCAAPSAKGDDKFITTDYLQQCLDEYYPAFAALMAEQGKELPGYVQREFEEFLQCGRLEHGFLRV